jgi:hypothetical protein
MVDFKILPESFGQVVRQVFEAVVVQAGLALAKVGDQQVTDRAACQAVAVDQLLGCELDAGPQLPEPRRGLLAEQPEIVEGLVERRNVTWPGRQHRGLGVHELRYVADRDVDQGSALGGKDYGRALRGEPYCPLRDSRAPLVVLAKSGEPVEVAVQGQAVGQLGLDGGHADQPR